MITEKDIKIIKEISKQYNVKKVLLFGSNLLSNKESRDIDIAVDGISSKDFFKYYGDLLLRLSKPVDLIDLANQSKFIDIVNKEGKLIYG